MSTTGRRIDERKFYLFDADPIALKKKMNHELFIAVGA